MIVYVVLSTLAALISGMILIVRTKRVEGIKYGVLDKVGLALNALLLNVYLIAFVPFTFIGLLCVPEYSGLLGALGYVMAFIVNSWSLVFCLGLAFSVVLRKKGKSKLSFMVQFMGLVAMVVSFVIFALCYESLFSSLN